MARSFLSILSIAAILTVQTSASAQGFFDTRGTPYETAFEYLSNQGVIQGYRDGSGKPNQYLNRAEALKVALALSDQMGYEGRIKWLGKHMPPLPLFLDVPLGEWYAPYVELAFQDGIVTGYPDGTFRPANLVSVEEAVTLIMRAFDERGADDRAELSQYIQNMESKWFTPYINGAISRNLVMHRGTLRLGTPITRGQFFDIAYRLHKVRDTGTIAFDGPEPESTAPIRVAQPIRTIPGTSSGPAAQGAVAVSHPQGSEKYFSVTMPSLGIKDLTITHPTDAFTSKGLLSVLSQGIGHLFAYPGTGGKVMLYGHSSSYPWDVSQYTKIFRRVNELNPGDKIYLTYEGNLYVYEVAFEQTVAARDTAPFNDNSSGEELILYTCWPPDSIAQRYLVHAYPVETVALQ